jgi:hypothetical protein
MIQIIHGKKGSGKTKRLIDMTNDAINQRHGDVVFVDDDNRYMFDLRHEIRFVNAGEYGISSPEMFFGFLCGMITQNYDITHIFVDAFLRLVNVSADETGQFFERLEALTQKHDITFVLSVSCDDCEAPEFMQKYFI